MVNTSEDCLFKALREENSAWLDYRINAEFALQKYATLNPNIKENPIFVRSADSDYTCHIVWSFRKGSPWIESFDKVLLNILAAGLYDVWKERDGHDTRVAGAKWLRENTDSGIRNRIASVMEALTTGPKPLDNNSLFGSYLVMVLGVLLSAVAWVGENAKYFTEKYLERRNTKLQFCQ
jgi:hypothetical protein